MAINKGSTQIGRLYKGSVQIGKVYKGSTLVYSAESDAITLQCAVTQSSDYNNMAVNYADYTIAEDWDEMTVLSSRWGKSYGKFQTDLMLVAEDGTVNTLVSRYGAYGGSSMAEEAIVEAGSTFAVKKGQTVRLQVAASYDSNVSGQHITTSYLTFQFT